MKLSLVTVSYNAAGTIGDTIRSVLTQRLDGFELEYILIDGASTDGTAEIIRAVKSERIVVRAVSEPDRGLYDAMNKGLAMATGDVVGIVNADDILEADDVLARIAAAFTPETDVIWGDVRFVRELDGPTVRYCTGRFFRNWMFRFGVFPAHPSTFFRREWFGRLGGYSLDYSITADFEFMHRLFAVHRARARYLPLCTTRMRLGGVSTNGFKANLEINRQDLAALRAHGVRSCLPLIYLKYFAKIFGYLRRGGTGR